MPIQARPTSEEEAQEEDCTPGRRHHGGLGSILLPAGTGAAEREGVGEALANKDGCLSHLHESSVEVEARHRYTNIPILSVCLHVCYLWQGLKQCIHHNTK